MTRPTSPDAEPVEFYRTADFSAETSFGYLMKRIVNSMVHQADKRLEAHGLTSAQWGPLLRLKKVGPSTPVDLARWLQVDGGSLTRLLDRLEKKGLCKRVRSIKDRRIVQIELTAEGEAAIIEVPAVLVAVLNAHLEGFSKSEWLALNSYLERMLQTAENMRAST